MVSPRKWNIRASEVKERTQKLLSHKSERHWFTWKSNQIGGEGRLLAGMSSLIKQCEFESILGNEEELVIEQGMINGNQYLHIHYQFKMGEVLLLASSFSEQF